MKLLYLIFLAASLNVIPAPREVNVKDVSIPLSSVTEYSTRIVRSLPSEGYVLKVGRNRISIKAGSEAGIFYARQTLAQEAAANGGNVWLGTIKDEPRFAWRGFMLDEARHFLGMEYVKKTLDQMAYFKLNKFHWHLTDTEGWRIEIKSYPELTRTGALGDVEDRNKPVQFYTQDQIREIVEYAAQRHIEVIPEIDMPGHAMAATRAYPEYSGGVHPKFPNFTFNPGTEKTYQFLAAILKEVAALFPGKYIHIGCDEVSFGISAWKDNTQVKDLMARENLSTLKEVEAYFINRMAGVVLSLGKEAVMWCDALEDGVKPYNNNIMWWRHDKVEHLMTALDNGFPTVLTPRMPLYLDYVQYGYHTEGPRWRQKQYSVLEDIYYFPERNSGDWTLSDAQLSNVLGVQGNMWTERIQNPERADFMGWPRLCAIAESGWTKFENKDYESFCAAMEHAYKYLDSRGVYYFDTREASAHPEPRMPEMFHK